MYESLPPGGRICNTTIMTFKFNAFPKKNKKHVKGYLPFTSALNYNLLCQTFPKILFLKISWRTLSSYAEILPFL